MTIEKSNVPQNASIVYREWIIHSGDANLFMVNGVHFENVILVLGEEYIYWIFYNISQLSECSTRFDRITVNYCSCCLGQQYPNIMKMVHKTYEEKNSRS